MIAIFTLIYCATIWVIFYKLKIKPTPVKVAVSVVVGVVAIGLIVILWKFSSPMASNLVVSRHTIQIVPQVKGPIIKISAKPNVPLKKGKDILFEIQKDTYQFTYDKAAATLRSAEKNVQEAQSTLIAFKASVAKFEASLDAAKAEYDVAINTESLNPGAISKLKVTQLKAQNAAAVAALAETTANADGAKFALEAAEDNVIIGKARLDAAEFDLEQCTVYAPADGFVTSWAVREGTMAVSLPLAPLGTFIDTSRTELLASFSQNVLSNVQLGDPVEMAFKSRPGEFFSGKVEAIVRASGEAQFVTSGHLPSASDLHSDGMLLVKFVLDDEEVAQSLAMGTAGNVAIYTNKGAPFHVISKVTIRIAAWMYYLIPF